MDKGFLNRFEKHVDLLFLEAETADPKKDLLLLASLKTLLEFIFEPRKFKFTKYIQVISQDSFEIMVYDPNTKLGETMVEIWEMIREFGQLKFLKTVHLWKNRSMYTDYYLEIKRKLFETKRKVALQKIYKFKELEELKVVAFSEN